MTRATWKNKVRWNAVLRPIVCSLLVGGPLMLGGCRKAAVDKVDRLSPSVQPTISVGDPAYILKPQNPASEPWYRPLQVVLEKKAGDEKELEEMVNAGKAPVSGEMKKLLDEIELEVLGRHKAGDKWSMLSLSCGRARKAAEIFLNADIGLTKLYAKRPVIAFNEMPLDLCVAKLSRESGIHDSQPRGYNPRVYWSKTNVSALEAYEGVLGAHGFEHKFSDVSYKITLRLQDYETRLDFVSAAVEAIMTKGKALNEARPAITVTPREAPAPAESGASEKTGDFKEPAKK